MPLISARFRAAEKGHVNEKSEERVAGSDQEEEDFLLPSSTLRKTTITPTTGKAGNERASS
jgi:hypothetical protein